MAVEIVHVVVGPLLVLALPAHHVVQAAFHFRTLVNPRAEQGGDPGRGAREPRAVGHHFHVAEPAVGILAILDILDAVIHCFFRDEDAGIAGRPQGHNLTHRHRDVGILRSGMIAPAALRVLRVHDQVDRPLESPLDAFARVFGVGQAGDLGQEQGAETVAVHRPVRDVLLAVQIAGLAFLLVQHVFQGSGDGLAVNAAAGLVAACHHGQGGQAGDGHVPLVLPRAERPVLTRTAVLVAGQVSQALVDGFLGGGGDHALGSLPVRQAIPGRFPRQRAGAARKAQHGSATLGQKSPAS